MRSLLSLWTMWSDTRKVALMAMTAAVYVAVLLPFKIATLIPGFTEIRPGAAVPVAFGALLGAPACWGSAFGNLVGDLLGGQFGPASAFGFLSNFLLAWVPWRVAAYVGLDDWIDRRASLGAAWYPGLALRFVPCSVLGSAACAMTLGWGVDLMGSLPYAFLANVVFLNNVLVATVLGPIVVGILGPRVHRWELGMDEEGRAPAAGTLGLALVVLGALGGYLALNLAATGGLNLLPAGFDAPKNLPGVTGGGAAALLATLVGLLLL